MFGPDATLEKGPAREPNFSMKSRSLRKLLRPVERYEAGRITEAETTSAGEASSTRRCAHFFHEEIDENTGKTLYWTIQELHSSRSFANEGEAMHHCPGVHRQQTGGKTIWSVQVRDGDTWHRVLTVAIDPVRRVLKDARGRFNANPENEFEPDDHAVEGQRRSRLNANDRYLGRRAERRA